MARSGMIFVLVLLLSTVASLAPAESASVIPSNVHEFELPLRADGELLTHVFPERRSRPRACLQLRGTELARCLISRRYEHDEDAQRLATLLFQRMHAITGPDGPQVMDGDYRGRVVLEPALPFGTNARHLMFLNAAFDEFSVFFSTLARHATAPIRFAFRGIPLKFYRTMRARTPSAYVDEGVVAYNLNGELFASYAGARDTLFHELFHVNDIRHQYWSKRTLSPIYEDILVACADDSACFDVHAPYDTRVDDGVYYAFHPTSSVVEYTAELAIRYYREQSAILAGAPVLAPFKCGSPRNALAWRQIVQEFFGGVDRVPACPRQENLSTVGD